MTRVLITSIGGSPAIDVARCLRRDRSLHLVGADANAWGRQLGQRLVDEVIALPSARSDAASWAEALIDAARTVDFVFLGLDLEIAALASVGRALPVATALAPMHVLPLLLDKAKTERAARASGVLPRTLEFQSAAAIDDVFAAMPPPLWIRPGVGTSGAGSLKVTTRDQAAGWLASSTALGVGGSWIAQEFLPGKNTNWSGVFVDGELVASASMERLEYLLGSVAPSGVTGQVRLCETVVMPAVAEAALRVVHALDPKPHGIYSVDLREDVHGQPKVTEVNPRLAGRPWLYAHAGVNLPLAALRALRGLPLGDAVEAGGLRPGMQMYRQVDVDPLFGPRPE